MTLHTTLLPAGWPRPRGYANGIAAEGRMVFTGGIIGWDEKERIVATDLAGQFAQVLRNTLAVLAEASAGPEHIVRMTWYLTDLAEYRANLTAIGATYRALIGKNYPSMAVLGVSALVEPKALIEIETTAIVP